MEENDLFKREVGNYLDSEKYDGHILRKGILKNLINEKELYKKLKLKAFEKDITMKEFKYVVTDPEGIHARPAGELVKAAKEFSSKITITKDGKSGDCKKIFGVMALAVKCGNEVTITVEGEDEEAAAAKIEEFMKSNM